MESSLKIALCLFLMLYSPTEKLSGMRWDLERLLQEDSSDEDSEDELIGCENSCSTENINLADITFDDFGKTVFTFELFKQIMTTFIEQRKEEMYYVPLWENDINPFNFGFLPHPGIWQEFNTHQIFYAQKKFVETDTEIISVSDLHGDIETLFTILTETEKNGILNKNLELKNNTVFIGTGDYMDRGGSSLKTICILALYAIKNRGRFILLRGNHEELESNLRPEFDINKEINRDFVDIGNVTAVYDLLAQAYELMPSALYLGTKKRDNSTNNLILFSHGLSDFKFAPESFFDFDDALLRESGGNRYSSIKANVSPDELYVDPVSVGKGFVWHDIGVNQLKTVEITPSNRISYCPAFIWHFFNKHTTPTNKVCVLVGGHQHDLIKSELDIEAEQPSEAAIAISIDNFSQITSSVLERNEPEGRCLTSFSIVKLISGPVAPFNYPPTYLHIRQDEGGLWNFRAVECSCS